ncbi:MAG: YchJ family protein [Opitutaceae bacterium]
MPACPCGSGLEYDACCGAVISGAQPAATAEALMRSRYTAYVVRAFDHLKDTLTEEQRADFSADEAAKWAESSEWLGFTILNKVKGEAGDDEGLVEFSARFRAGGKEHEHVEASRFVRVEGKWHYAGMLATKGETVRRETPKIGRNDPCPCGSGKKYKRCCGAAV